MIETIMTENFHQINVRYQTTDPRKSENIKQDYSYVNHIQTTENQTIKKNPERSQRGENKQTKKTP